MRHLARDLRYAWRGLSRSPLFTIVALLSIALGIGANTAIFTLVDEVLLRTLPVRNPEQLVLFNGARNHFGSNSGGNMLSYPKIDQSLLNDRIIATLSTAFGALATLLAVIGLYGVMAYTVARRTREIGVRLALGAVPGDVVWMVMREVLTLVSIGVALGLAAAWSLSRVVSAQLYGVTPTDPTTIVAASASLAIVALLAGYIPAIRATRVNPVRALRYE